MSTIAGLTELLVFLKDAFLFVVRSLREKEIRDKVSALKGAQTEDETRQALHDLVRAVNK